MPAKTTTPSKIFNQHRQKKKTKIFLNKTRLKQHLVTNSALYKGIEGKFQSKKLSYTNKHIKRGSHNSKSYKREKHTQLYHQKQKLQLQEITITGH